MEYVWIAGVSGVGKATLVKSLLDVENCQLRSRFGIRGSIKAFGPTIRKYTVPSLSTEEADHVLIKWQLCTHSHIEMLKELRPDCSHRVLLLWRPLGAVVSDLRERSPEWTQPEQIVVEDWRKIRGFFRGYDFGVPVELIDGSNPSYPKLPNWPTLVH